MLSLVNVIFDRGGLLQKRNGYAALTALPDNSNTTLSTFNNNLVAIGTKLNAFSADSMQWINTGNIQPVSLTTLPVVRTSASQIATDSQTAPNGLVCVVYQDSANNCAYQILSSETGQIIVPVTFLPSGSRIPRVFVLGNNFIILFTTTVSATPHLQYLAIPINNPQAQGTATDISAQILSVTTGYDGFVAGQRLYIAWNGSDGGGAIRITYLDATLTLHSIKVLASNNATLMSVTADLSSSTFIIWVTWWNTSNTNGFTAAFDINLNTVLAKTQVITGETLVTLTSIARLGVLHFYYEINNNYTYASIRSDFVERNTCTQGGTVGAKAVVLRSVGLSSKPFYVDVAGSIYFLVGYSGAFQPTLFLINDQGNVISRFAYSNAGGLNTTQILPSPYVNGDFISYSYLFKDLIAPVNKIQGVASPGGIFSQNGINLITFQLNNTNFSTAEIAGSLHVTGGITWMYDGSKPVEQNFNVWPEDLTVTTSGSGGSITAQKYFYVFTYEWTDGSGNIHRSAPSIPYTITTTGSSSTNTINVPTLRITYKTAPNSVRLVGYRWSAAQEIYYQFTTITTPILNDPTVDSIAITDTLADSSILGNFILYTTGGVVEDIGPPAPSDFLVYKSRLFLIDAEDPNVLWYSKQVIQNTPVEFSDLFTIYVAPNTSAQSGTGGVTVLSAMDDKLLAFRKNSIFYITGIGPDITDANNDFSDPTLITSTVGCTNVNSIVFIPQGLIFQSDKGLWLLGRDLSTSYIGAPVEKYNTSTVKSAVNIPATNQVRFTLTNENGTSTVLMYDYYYDQWATFEGVPAISSTLYQNLHTYLNALGQVFQETPGVYLDGSNPVLMSFTTSWIKIAGLLGFQRSYSFQFLGQYLSPHFIHVEIAYDYNPSSTQQVLISPFNFTNNWGGDPVWGDSSPWGGFGSLEEFRVFLTQQKCQTFQITMNEVYDASLGVQAGAGFTLSGITVKIGLKQGWHPTRVSESVG